AEVVVDAAAEFGRVAEQGAAADRQRAGGVEDAAAEGGRRVAGQGAAADRQRAEAVDDAAADDGRVAGQGAVADRQRAGGVEDAAAEGGRRVAGQGAAADRQRATVDDGPAHVRGAPGEDEVLQHDVGAWLHGEDPRRAAAADGR